VLTAVLPVVTRRQLRWLAAMLRLWGIVLAANVAGCLVFAFALSHLPMVEAKIGGEMGTIVHRLMANTPFEMFAKGIGAGWLIAALVWILASSDGAEFLIIGLLTYLIALFGFTHIVAGASEAFYGWMIYTLSFDDLFLKFFLPTLLGNVVGGTFLFSLLSYAQVREEITGGA
jgi:formate/nitrite transporter FocA (FNT family)